MSLHNGMAGEYRRTSPRRDSQGQYQGKSGPVPYHILGIYFLTFSMLRPEMNPCTSRVSIAPSFHKTGLFFLIEDRPAYRIPSTMAALHPPMEEYPSGISNSSPFLNMMPLSNLPKGLTRQDTPLSVIVRDEIRCPTSKALWIVPSIHIALYWYRPINEYIPSTPHPSPKGNSLHERTEADEGISIA